MSSKSCASPWRSAFSTYNLPHVVDLTALASLAELMARMQTDTGSSECS
jgi:hypothetical protein